MITTSGRAVPSSTACARAARSWWWATRIPGPRTVVPRRCGSGPTRAAEMSGAEAGRSGSTGHASRNMVFAGAPAAGPASPAGSGLSTIDPADSTGRPVSSVTARVNVSVPVRVSRTRSGPSAGRWSRTSFQTNGSRTASPSRSGASRRPRATGCRAASSRIGSAAHPAGPAGRPSGVAISAMTSSPMCHSRRSAWNRGP